MPSSSPSSTRCGWVARICWSLNVPGSDSSALQMAYLTSPGCDAADQLPLLPGREPGPAHPAQPGVLQRVHDRVRVELAGQQRAQGGVALARPPTLPGRGRSATARCAPSPGAARHDSFGVAGPGAGDERVGVLDGRRPLVDRHRRRGVAAAETGHLDQLDLGVVAVALAQLRQPGVAVAQEARQVVADVQGHLRRRLGAEVRVERDQPLDLVPRAAGVAGELLQLRARQPPQPGLDRVQRRDQRRPGELPGPRLHTRHPPGPDLARPGRSASVMPEPPAAPPARRRT